MTPPSPPNILLVVPDGMQAAVTFPESGCRTPHIDRLAGRGVRCRRAYTVNPTCSPARCSLMTGMLPHNHGVLQVEHATEPDQDILRREYPHWAKLLQDAGYHTGYFGKWHIEPENDLESFGWSVNGSSEKAAFRNIGRGEESTGDLLKNLDPVRIHVGPEGYHPVLHYGVSEMPTASRDFAQTTTEALGFLESAKAEDRPWACCVSYAEPNVPLIAGREMYHSYDPAHRDLPRNHEDRFQNSPGLYRREKNVYASLSTEEWKTLRSVYYALISELDAQFGRLLDAVEADGENTIIIFISDHGRYVGGHGFDHHNVGAFEEIYHIPMVAAGPGLAKGVDTHAIVSILDLFPTILEWCGIPAPPRLDGKSLARFFRNPEEEATRHQVAFAESQGTRFNLTQRVLWEGDWKFVFNGFDFDELYHLSEDPDELHNLAQDLRYEDKAREMMTRIWEWIKKTNDQTLLGTHYLPMRIALVGPNESTG